MSKGDTFENDLLKLIFNGTAIANLAQNGTSPVTSLYVSLHTADPGDAGTQGASEANYISYARVAVARTTGGWTAATAGSTSPVSNISFPAATSGTNTITHFGIGMAISGATTLLYSGTVSPSIAVSNGVTPILTTSTTITED